MAYRKDLERSALMMDKIKNPQKIPTLGAKKIMTENTSSEKDYLIDKFATNPNDPKFGGGQLGHRKEIQGYLKEINNSNKPVLRNPGDRAIRNKKNNRRFDRGI
tara:strand:+ start:149 stop:460 length:312 start_codon:yes stop_codon:yes gene_type:complete